MWVGDHQGGRHEHHQRGQHLVEGGGVHALCPGSSGPGNEQAAGQQVDRDGPACGDLGGRDRCKAGGQGDQEHDQAHRLVQDDGRECREPEGADQQRQAELCAAQPDHPAQHADDRSRAEYDGH
jgi:hypothetical protein